MKQAPPTANPSQAQPVAAEPQTMWDQIFSGLVPGSIGLPTLPTQSTQSTQTGTNSESALGALGGTNSPMSLEASRALTGSG